MSSHHFVRDKQEAALLVANGQKCSDNLLHQLLEWNPFLLALDGAINRLDEMGLKVDAVLGDFDSTDNLQEIIAKQHPIQVIEAHSQDKTDLEKGLDYLISEGYSSVNIVWATGRRADHNLANISNIVKYRDLLNITLLDDYSRIFILPRAFKKWYVKNTLISLLPIGKVVGITSQNLMYPLNSEDLEIGVRIGSSNHVLEDGIVEITHADGHLLLMECFDLPQ